MIFDVQVKTEGEKLQRGDLFYEKRRLFRVDHVGKPRGKKRTFYVRMRLLAKINLNRQMWSDRG
jgi:hypothetical protein